MWIFQHFGFIVFLFIVVSIVRAVRTALKSAADQANRRTTGRSIANVDPEEAERVRRIQEEIRRKITERRGGDIDLPSAPATRPESPPLLRPTSQGTPPLDPFGGPIKRMLSELERRAEAQANPPPQSPPPLRPSATDDSERERMAEQRKLAERLKAAEAARLARRQPSAFAPAAASVGSASAFRAGVVEELRDPNSLRRAFVLREILGAPVGLR